MQIREQANVPEASDEEIGRNGVPGFIGTPTAGSSR
jgi:hypothetical protein